jgi:hypothetical protein
MIPKPAHDLALVLALTAAGCGGSDASPDAGTDAWLEPPDAFVALDAASGPDVGATPTDDAGTILPTYDAGDPFADDSGLGDPAWVMVDVLTDGSACAPLVACGGDVVGTWDVTGGCFELPIEESLSMCPGAAVTRRDGRARGRVTFDVGGLAHRVAQSEVEIEITVPSFCAAAVGGCAAIASAIRSSAPDSTCVTEASGDCRCAARQVTGIDDTDGYRLEGDQIVAVTAGRRWDYCIDGTTLTYRDVTPGAASTREPGIIELGRR